MDVLYWLRMPSKIILQMYPSTIPPIRLGMKNTVLKMFEPLIPWVKRYAIINANKLINNNDTAAYRPVYQNACTNVASLNALM